MSNADCPESLEPAGFAHEREGGSDRGSSGPVVLAHEPSFQLGPLTIDPPRRRIAHADGREEIVEPRVMQVLVALLRADGAVLSRDDLSRLCWEGRIVGDDAINRVLSRLRRSAEGIGKGVFRIETLTKVGYRLVRADTSERPMAMPAKGFAHRPLRRHLLRWAAIALAIIGLAAAAFAILRSNRAAPVPSVAVLSESRNSDAADLARTVAADLSRLAAARATDLSIVDSSRANVADYLLRIAHERRRDHLLLRATLSDRAGGALLWSAEFARPANEVVDLRQQMTAKVGTILLCALRGTDPTGVRLDVVTLRLFLAYCDGLDDGPDERLLATIRQVTERKPGFARGWAALARTEAWLGRPDIFRATDDPQRRAYRESARTHLLRARAIDPALSDIYLAETLLLIEPTRWAQRLAILERGMAAAPDPMLAVWHGNTLFAVGRLADALESWSRMIALDPANPLVHCAKTMAYAHSADFDAARDMVEECERLLPGALQARFNRYAFERDFGDPRVALAMLDDRANLPFLGTPDARDRNRRYLRARAEPTPANVDAVLAAYAESLHRSPATALRYLQVLVVFGRVDEAYRLAAAPELQTVMRSGTEVLFFPHMRPLRRDPRFMPLTHRLGLLQYWQVSGHWPDFCGDPGLPYDCRAEAHRLLGRAPQSPIQPG